MQDAAYLPLTGNRFTPFSLSFVFQGLDLTYQALRAQIRVNANAGGTPLATLEWVTNPAIDGIRLVQTVPQADGTVTSYVSMFITKATIEAMAAASGLTGDELTDDSDLSFAWDMHYITNANPQVIMFGPFTLKAGVTQ